MLDPTGKVHLPFSTPNGLVAPGQLIHVAKPLSAFQDQLQIRRTFGKHTVSFGTYFANYSQDNHWFFTQILTDVGDQTHFLDAVVTPPGGPPDSVTKNGFVNQLSGYANGSGQTSVISGVLGGEIQLTDRLRADLGVRGEYDKFVQSSENTSTFDLDANPATTFNNETFGNGSFRHFDRGISDWSASLGLNFSLRKNLSLYAAGARGYKMPALDEFLNATAEQQVDLFESKEVQSVEGGVKGFVGPIGFTVGGFWTKLKNVVSQGLVIDTLTGGSSWIIVPSPDNKSYGTEIELVATPAQGLQLLGSATILKAELGTGAGADIGSRISRRADIDRQRRGVVFDPGSPVEGGLALGGQATRGCEGWRHAPGLQLFQPRGRVCAQHRHDHQPRPAERIPGQGARGRQPQAGDHRPGLSRAADPASAVPGVGVVRPRRGRTGATAALNCGRGEAG